MMTEEQMQALIADMQSEKLVLEKWRVDWNARDKVNYQAIDIALAALNKPAIKLPDDWVVVPREPTEEMIVAGDQFMDGLSRLGDAYDAMLEAAPDAPHTAQIEPICATGGAEWVKVSERLPDDSRWCVVHTEYGYFLQCWGSQQGWVGDEISIPNCDVTHWMPLPAAPKS